MTSSSLVRSDEAPGFALPAKMQTLPVPLAAVLFDLNGTLVDQSPLAERLRELGAPEGAFQAWFERLLHSALTVTVAGDFVPFADLAETTLATTLAQLGVDAEPAQVLALLPQLPLVDDAVEALDALRAAGIRAAVLTNSGAGYAEEILVRNGVRDRIEAVVSIDEAWAYKPNPAPYRVALGRLGLAPQQAALVAAHGWDVLGAQAAGLTAVWVDRLERRWPFPGPEPLRAGSLVEAVRMLENARS